MSVLRYPELALTIQSDLGPDEIATRIGAIESAIATASGDDETGGLDSPPGVVENRAIVGAGAFFLPNKEV